MTVMNTAMLSSCVKLCIAKDVPVFIWGAPGIGKSDTVREIGRELDIPVIDFRATLRDSVDLRGLPLVDAKTGTARWLPPDELPNVKRHGEKGILFLDELNAANQSVQAACFGLVLDRRLGEYVMPKGWIPIAAGNRLSDRAAAQRMPSALANRFAHFELAADLDAWGAWAQRVKLHPAVVAFVRFRPEMLHKMPSADEKAFPSPRSWAMAARFADAPAGPFRQSLVAALVGEGPAAEFEGFMRIWTELPSIDQILKDPQGVHVPDMGTPSALYAVAGALARRATRDNFANVMVYAARLPKEFHTLVAIDAVRRDEKLKSTKPFADWAVVNKDVTT